MNCKNIIVAACLVQLILASVAMGATIDGPTGKWTAIFYSTVDPDPINDSQTGQAEADIVGTSTLSGFFTDYDEGLTSGLSDDTLSFRLRLGTEETPSGFSHIAIIGLDADLDGTNDAFIMLDNSGQNEIALYTTGNKANDSPKTTSTKSTSYSYPQNSTNYDWSMVSSNNCTECTLAADYDLDNDFNPDFYLSFSVPFEDIIAVLALDGITGITPQSQINYIAGTSTNTNSFNQDLVGVDGDPIATSTWASLGAISQTNTFIPAPEPGTGTMLGLGLGWLAISRKKRRNGVEN